ncbi:hypothetical protein ABEY69_23780 [Priestia filamentosa]|uniref:hypothetical protein n=1 Tax=Priestia filamentosa TaxID=1402861 RepID=UPI003D2A725F
MSDFYKRRLKRIGEDKYPRKGNYKEERKLRYRDKKCDDCHNHVEKCDCKKKCDHKEKKHTFTEFDVSESSRIVFPSIPSPAGGTTPPLNVLASVDIDVEDKDDKVLLQGTVEWEPDDIGILAAIVALIFGGTIGVPLSVSGTFRIWRSTDHQPFTPIFETTDTATVSSLALVAPAGLLTLPFGATTTSFHWVDKDPSCGENRYFLTLDLSLVDDPTVTFTPGVDLDPVTGLLSSFIDPITASVETQVFTATEIEED